MDTGSERVSVSLPRSYIKAMEELVKRGVYQSKSEVVRDAIRSLLESRFPDLYRALLKGSNLGEGRAAPGA